MTDFDKWWRTQGNCSGNILDIALKELCERAWNAALSSHKDDVVNEIESSISEEIEKTQEYLIQKVPVEIYHNDETGYWLWSVQVAGTDFWLESFKSQPEAEEYCEKHELPVSKRVLKVP